VARLVQLLSSFIEVSGAYALARLEFAMRHSRLPAPPVLHCLAEPSEETARERWDAIEWQLEAARRYVGALDDRRGKRAGYDPAYARLQRTVRELDRYARAVRWVMTVEERGAG
jgi:hypothetical protein